MIENEIRLTYEEIKQLIKKEKYNELKEVGQSKEYCDNALVQSQIMKFAILEGDFEKAIQISKKGCFVENVTIQSQIMKMYMENGEFDKAIEIGEKEEFKDDELIQNQLRKIKQLKREQHINETRQSKENQNDFKDGNSQIDNKTYKFLRKIKTKIYYDKIDDKLIEEINESEILSEYQKTLIMLAICEKRGMLSRAKQIQAKANFEDGSQKKEVKKILERMKAKKKIFDLGKYDELLKWRFEDKLVKKYTNEQSNDSKLEQDENEDDGSR